MATYNSDNIAELYQRVVDKSISARQDKQWRNIRRNLITHTKGIIFDKIYKIFENETLEATKSVVNSYEPLTKGSIKKGIDNIARIFSNTQFRVMASGNTLSYLNDMKFFEQYAIDWIDTSVSTDPNSLGVWVLDKDRNWKFQIVESRFITSLGDDFISFIDLYGSDYNIVQDEDILSRYIDTGKNSCVETFMSDNKYIFNRKKIVYISKNQYIEINEVNGNKIESFIYDFPKELTVKPYSYTGTEYIEDDVFGSPVSEFIPFGNVALIQFRGFINSHNLFAYPRLEEIELPCDDCSNGYVPCDCENENECTTCNGTRERSCNTCKGSGYLSVQSLFKIYKRKILPETSGISNDYPSARFIMPDTAIFNYLKDTYKETLREAEKAIYVQQDDEGGQAISAEAREKKLQGMYSWLMRIGNVFYSNLEHAVSIYQQMQGDMNTVTIEKPISYAIIGEMEAFSILTSVLDSKSPSFLKAGHVKSFTDRYISKSNPIHKVLEVLQIVDPFIFYNNEDLTALSSYGLDTEDAKIHTYAFPMLMQMLAMDNLLIDKDSFDIAKLLNEKIKQKNTVTPLAERLNAVT